MLPRRRRLSWIASPGLALGLLVASQGCGGPSQETTPGGATKTPELEVDESLDPEFSRTAPAPKARKK